MALLDSPICNALLMLGTYIYEATLQDKVQSSRERQHFECQLQTSNMAVAALGEAMSTVQQERAAVTQQVKDSAAESQVGRLWYTICMRL